MSEHTVSQIVDAVGEVDLAPIDQGLHPAIVALGDVCRLRLDTATASVSLDLVDGVTSQVIRPGDLATAEDLFATLHARLASSSPVDRRLPETVPEPTQLGTPPLIRATALTGVVTTLYGSLWGTTFATANTNADLPWSERLLAEVQMLGPEPVLYGLVVMAVLTMLHIVRTNGEAPPETAVPNAGVSATVEYVVDVPFLDAIRRAAAAKAATPPLGALDLSVDDEDPLADLL